MQQERRKVAIAQAIGAITRRRHETKTERPQEKKFWDLMNSPAKKQRVEGMRKRGHSSDIKICHMLACYDICAEEGLLEAYAEEIAEELAPKPVMISEEMIKAQEARLAERAMRRAALEAGEAAVAAAVAKRAEAPSATAPWYAVARASPPMAPARHAQPANLRDRMANADCSGPMGGRSEPCGSTMYRVEILPSFGSNFANGALPQGHPSIAPAMPGGLPSSGWGPGRT